MYLKHYNNILRKEEEEGNSGANLAIKIISIAVFLAMVTVFGLMPYYIEKCKKKVPHF